MTKSSSPSSRPKKYVKSELSCKYTPLQIKRVVAASKKDYTGVARKFNMALSTARLFRKQSETCKVSSAEQKQRVHRLLSEGIRFCLERKRSYKNSKLKRPTKNVRYAEILDFMQTNCANYSVQKGWIPKERTLRTMISADKKKRDPTGHKRGVERLPNSELNSDQFERMKRASRCY